MGDFCTAQKRPTPTRYCVVLLKAVHVMLTCWSDCSGTPKLPQLTQGPLSLPCSHSWAGYTRILHSNHKQNVEQNNALLSFSSLTKQISMVCVFLKS